MGLPGPSLTSYSSSSLQGRDDSRCDFRQGRGGGLGGLLFITCAISLYIVLSPPNHSAYPEHRRDPACHGRDGRTINPAGPRGRRSRRVWGGPRPGADTVRHAEKPRFSFRLRLSTLASGHSEREEVSPPGRAHTQGWTIKHRRYSQGLPDGRPSVLADGGIICLVTGTSLATIIVFAVALGLGISADPFMLMILPQVHLRKPCYDFYFL